ncbi:hypothetical protein HYDPIDRAFT_35104, partial [Hydnomerulius pinastri MD-312]
MSSGAVRWPTKEVSGTMKKNLITRRSYLVRRESRIHIFTKPGSKSVADVPSKYHDILHTVSFQYEVYKHVLQIIQEHTELETEDVVERLFLHMKYLDDVRQEFLGETRNQKDASSSPTLEYHMWLEYTQGAYDAVARKQLSEEYKVTYGKVKSGKVNVLEPVLRESYVRRCGNAKYDKCGANVAMGKDPIPRPEVARRWAADIINELKAIQGAKDADTMEKDRDADDKVVDSVGGLPGHEVGMVGGEDRNRPGTEQEEEEQQQEIDRRRVGQGMGKEK